MTLPKLESPTAELKAYLIQLQMKARAADTELLRLRQQRDYLHDCLIEVLDELNRRESCSHEDFTENLEGRTCRTCGLETK